MKLHLLSLLCIAIVAATTSSPTLLAQAPAPGVAAPAAVAATPAPARTTPPPAHPAPALRRFPIALTGRPTPSVRVPLTVSQTLTVAEWQAALTAAGMAAGAAPTFAQMLAAAGASVALPPGVAATDVQDVQVFLSATGAVRITALYLH